MSRNQEYIIGLKYMEEIEMYNQGNILSNWFNRILYLSGASLCRT